MRKGEWGGGERDSLREWEVEEETEEEWRD